MSRSNAYIVILAAGVLLGLAGCGSRPYYSDIPEPEVPEPGARVAVVQPQTNVYTVKSGDTLHSIAFAAGTDWSRLARLNGISAPYTIYPGQRLRLSTSREPLTLGMDSDRSAVPAVAAMPRAQPSTGTSGMSTQAQSTPAPASAPLPAASAKPGDWLWPGTGRVVQGFADGAQPHKGIDIAGNTGDAVVAARGGTVVYAGNGIRGYGNLLIIKHDAHWLSAYAHNSRLLVAEGDSVRAGQRIAEMGDSGTDRPKLHFEVRRQGNPVDPLQVLPGR